MAPKILRIIVDQINILYELEALIKNFCDGSLIGDHLFNSLCETISAI